jgi:thioredoxin-related protein
MRTIGIIFLLFSALFGSAQTFDSKRDPAADLQVAMIEAQHAGKRIILDVGGDWCPYCREMDELFRQHPELAKLRDDNFVVVKVYYGDDNKNAQFLSRYEKVQGIPHFYVLDEHGQPLHSQHIRDLREARAYSVEKMMAFLLQFSTDIRRTN